MGINYNESEKAYDVTYYKRHPITRVPFRAARKGVKTKAEANRVYTELVIQVEQKLHEKIIPKWGDFLSKFKAASLERGLMFKTVENCDVCLRAHTYDLWKDRFIDSFNSEEIRKLLIERVGSKSKSHQLETQVPTILSAI